LVQTFQLIKGTLCLTNDIILAMSVFYIIHRQGLKCIEVFNIIEVHITKEMLMLMLKRKDILYGMFIISLQIVPF
jgi:hypothetical protein